MEKFYDSQWKEKNFCLGKKEEIVISGISGRFPESNNMEEFKENLFNNIDMVTDDDRRWASGIFGIPTRTGKLKEIDKFDANFFGVHAKQANRMDPQLRILLETTFEAILDAGINPEIIRGKKIGVFIGSTFNETEDAWKSANYTDTGYGLLGCNTSMIANRVSYSFDFKGPSYTLNSACSSSLLALDQAVLSIKNGYCEAAIVGGVNLTLTPETSLQFLNLNMLANEGKCKSFDVSANGYVRSEAVVSIYIQKAENAKRVYATIVHTKTNNDGFKEEGITFPGGKTQKVLLEEIYSEAEINPEDVCYVEAHGTGTAAGDSEESNSILDFFCQHRDSNNKLLIGSVKSNMGHSEPTSGLCGIAKMIIAIQNGIIPANLWQENPIYSIRDARIKIVNENINWQRGICGINSFGFGGSNVHIILKPFSKKKTFKTFEQNLPIIIPLSGRTKESVLYQAKCISNLKNNDIKWLFHEIAKYDIRGHYYRGFLLQNGDKFENSIVKIDDGNKRPIWFICSGMGSQWNGMGKQLMNFEVFSKSIKKSAKILEEFNFDLLEVIEKENEDSGILNSSISIVAIQIALVDILNSLEIIPDGIIGHSIGEIISSYIDGCFTHDQTIKFAYERAQIIFESNLPQGGMAAIGLTWEEAKLKCPNDIFPACHNARDSVTVSGPVQSIKNFVELLKNENIFAKEVNSGGIAFHSKYIKQISRKIRKTEIIEKPKERSSKWISTSLPESLWNTEGKLASAQYFENNIISPVYFYEALNFIPENALVIEIGPHCLFQSILKRTLGSKTINIGLMNQYQENSIYFSKAIAKIYLSGINLNFSKLYKKFEFPVPIETSMISPMIQWDHSISWDVPNFHHGKISNSSNTIEISLNNENDSYFAGHVIDGRIIFPTTGYIFLVWKMFAKKKFTTVDKLPIVFEDLCFKKATIINQNEPALFTVNFSDGSNYFEVLVDEYLVVSGKIRLHNQFLTEFSNIKQTENEIEKNYSTLSAEEFYKTLKINNIEHAGQFKAVKMITCDGRRSQVEFQYNWPIFMDAMLTITIFTSLKNNGLRLPTNIQKVVIDPIKFLQYFENNNSFQTDGVTVSHYETLKITKSEGIEIIGLKTGFIQKKLQTDNPIYEKFSFSPYFDEEENFEKTTFENSLAYIIDIVIENSSSFVKKIAQIVSEDGTNIETHLRSSLYYTQAIYKFDFKNINIHNLNYESKKSLSFSPNYKKNEEKHYDEIDLILINDKSIIEKIIGLVKSNGFILLLQDKNFEINKMDFEIPKLRLVALKNSNEKTLLLFRKIIENKRPPTSINIDGNYSWIDELKLSLIRSTSEYSPIIYLVSQFDKNSGIIGLVNCLKKEPGGENIRIIFNKCHFDENKMTIDFSNPNTLLRKIIENDLVMNVIEGSKLGSFRHMKIKPEMEPIECDYAYLESIIKGEISSLKWIEGSRFQEFEGDFKTKEICNVEYASLNYRDIMLATGKLSPDSIPGLNSNDDGIFGIEFSGENKKGERVMGVVYSKALATTVMADKNFLWKIPENWSFEEAATVPVAYITAYYALIVKGKMQPGESILIHSGSGCTGQAAISIALSLGAKIFTTVSTEEKKIFLKSKFPSLTDNCFANSRDASFECHILGSTDGKGVDLVLNSLSGELLEASLRCLGINGRFLEIGKADLSNNSQMGMSLFLKNVSFHGVLSDMLCIMDCKEKKKVVQLLIEGVSSGIVVPLEKFIFQTDQIEEAFRFMAKGKHIGKVMIQMRNSKIVAQRKIHFDPRKTFIIIGGLGGFGLELSSWLVKKGVRNLVLVSRSGIKNGYQEMCIKNIREKGCEIEISFIDASTLSGANYLITKSQQLGPIGGIFNLAMVLKDGLFENQTAENFKAVADPKLKITNNIDKISRKLCDELEHFVVFSSVVSGRGNLGQSNYGFANSSIERICEKRKTDGFPGLAIQWGAIGDVGVLFNNYGENNRIEICGTKPQRIASCLATLEILLMVEIPVVSSMLIANIKEQSIQSGNETSIVYSILKVLGMKEITNEDLNLGEFGLDSLMSSEINQILKRKLNRLFTNLQIRQLTFKEIKGFNNL